MLSQIEVNKIVEDIAKKVGVKDDLMNIQQVAEFLGISEAAVRTRCYRGTIPYHRKHGLLYFSKEEVTRYYLSD